MHQTVGTFGIKLLPIPFTSKFVRVTNRAHCRRTAQRCAAWQAQPQAHSKGSVRRVSHSSKANAHTRDCACAAAGGDQLRALILDCDGVIVESEDLHREAYNAAFAHFKACVGKQHVIDWSEEFYDDLQNKVGGGKAKMRWRARMALLHNVQRSTQKRRTAECSDRCFARMEVKKVSGNSRQRCRSKARHHAVDG
ncbi:TPA: hypothetical protein ACH3X3_002818 [Trebouxia sp. C0006]